jgi:hypothetical protein
LNGGLEWRFPDVPGKPSFNLTFLAFSEEKPIGDDMSELIIQAKCL